VSKISDRTFFRIHERDIDRAAQDASWISETLTDMCALDAASDETQTWAVTKEKTQELITLGLATRIQSMFTGLESVLKNVLEYVDELTPSGSEWHRSLLEQAVNPGENRDGLISKKTFNDLNKLRSFRHFIRNAYGVELERARVEDLSNVALETMSSFQADWKIFKDGVLKVLDEDVGEVVSPPSSHNSARSHRP
jgi:hypothetical protein